MGPVRCLQQILARLLRAPHEEQPEELHMSSRRTTPPETNARPPRRACPPRRAVQLSVRTGAPHVRSPCCVTQSSRSLSTGRFRSMSTGLRRKKMSHTIHKRSMVVNVLSCTSTASCHHRTKSSSSVLSSTANSSFVRILCMQHASVARYLRLVWMQSLKNEQLKHTIILLLAGMIFQINSCVLISASGDYLATHRPASSRTDCPESLDHCLAKNRQPLMNI